MADRDKKKAGFLMRSDTIKKRSMLIGGRRTSVSLEDLFWQSLREIAAARDATLKKTIETIDDERSQTNLSSAIRVYVLRHYREAAPARRQS